MKSPVTLIGGLTVGVVEDAVKLDHAQWPGRCNEIALKLMQSGLLAQWKPVNRYGHWHGPVTERWFKWHEPLQRHGWLELEDGTIVDPTRWCFTGEYPHIYVGDNAQGWYDFGGDTLREAMHTPWPFKCDDGYGEIDPAHKSCKDERVELSPEFVEKLIPKSMFNEPQADLDDGFEDSEAGKPNATLRTCQVFWICNAPRRLLGDTGRTVLGYLIRDGYGPRIPIDTRQWVTGANSAMLYRTRG